MKNRLTIYFTFLLTLIGAVSCIEDSFTSSPSDQPTFSCDTLKLGEIYTLDGTPTKRFTVYNRHDKMLNISRIALREDDADMFRINVDGISGRTFSNIEIRPNDSILVYVEATIPENGVASMVEINRHIDFTTNGVGTTVVLNAMTRDVVRLRNHEVTADTHFTAERPYLIHDTLFVRPGVTLTLDAGTQLRFHDSAMMKVEGTLISEGTADSPVELTGDRTGFVAAEIPYELMSGQWGGVVFTSTSKDNHIAYTSIRNSIYGLTLDHIDTGDKPALTVVNSQIRNNSETIITAIHANVALYGCELSDAKCGILFLVGGKHIVNQCTLANYYLFSAIAGPAVQFEHLNADNDDGSGLPMLSADFTNCIIYGIGTEFSHGDLTGLPVTVRRCLLGSEGTDDDNFIDCIWGADPLYYTVRNEYLFDYRLQPESPAIGAANPALNKEGSPATDRYGLARGAAPDLGAYVYVAPAE